jgi:hypothetical protein
MSERRYNDETYKDHAIRVYAERYDDSSDWTIEVHVQAPDGSHLPPIRESDHPFPTLDIALASGSEIGRKVVDS